MVLLDGSTLTLDTLERIVRDRERVAIAPDAAARVRASRAVIDDHLARGTPVYGVNTGFGALADVAIPSDQLAALQLNLLRSHAAGLGDPLPVGAVRALMALRANVLAKGYSGIRLDTLEALIALLNANVHPWVPARGSVGASGDLAPLAHLALVLVGEGEVMDERPRSPLSTGERLPAQLLPTSEVLARAGLQPVVLAPKEGIALINGTQASTAVLALACHGRQPARPGGRHRRSPHDRCAPGLDSPVRSPSARRPARAWPGRVGGQSVGARRRQPAEPVP